MLSNLYVGQHQLLSSQGKPSYPSFVLFIISTALANINFAHLSEAFQVGRLEAVWNKVNVQTLELHSYHVPVLNAVGLFCESNCACHKGTK